MTRLAGVFAILLSFALLLEGCTHNSAEDAVAKLKERQKRPAAFLRVYNYAPGAVTLSIKGIPMAQDIQQGAYSPFIIVGNGKVKVTIKEGDKTLYDDSREIQPGAAVTAMVADEVIFFDDEQRYGNGQSVFVRAINGPGSASATISMDGADIGSVEPKKASPLKEVGAGQHTFKAMIGGKTSSATATFEPGKSYTVFVDTSGGSPRLDVVRNTPINEPMRTGGMAGA